MKSQELRIGNLVFHKDNPLPQIIDALDLYKAQSEYISELAVMDSFTPIQLTSEWLIKFGFVLMDDAGDFKGNDRFWVHGKFPGSLSLPNFEYQYKKGLFLKYVHQLQNLFFALTETELILK